MPRPFQRLDERQTIRESPLFYCKTGTSAPLVPVFLAKLTIYSIVFFDASIVFVYRFQFRRRNLCNFTMSLH